MKKGIHPNYRIVDIVMTDGSTFQTRSCFKSERMVLEIDSKSHPFYTGKQVLIDTAGRVDRFKKRFEKTQKLKETAQQDATA
jgi:large subunit ribosomal protein L31